MFPKQIRIWHWLNAIAIFGIAVTVFLKEFWMNKSIMSDTIMLKLAEMNATITQDQAISIAKAIRSPMWNWHIYLGIAVGVLILYRIFLAVKKIKIDDGKVDAKLKLVRLSHCVLMGIIAIVAITGAIAVYGSNIGVGKELAHDIKEVHELFGWIIMAFVPLHIIGVFVSDNTDYKGIVSKIISG